MTRDLCDMFRSMFKAEFVTLVKFESPVGRGRIFGEMKGRHSQLLHLCCSSIKKRREHFVPCTLSEHKHPCSSHEVRSQPILASLEPHLWLRPLVVISDGGVGGEVWGLGCVGSLQGLSLSWVTILAPAPGVGTTTSLNATLAILVGLVFFFFSLQGGPRISRGEIFLLNSGNRCQL